MHIEGNSKMTSRNEDQNLNEHPKPPLRRKAYSYGAIEDEERESYIDREISIGAATDISDLSEIGDLADEKFDLLASTESVRRWMGRPILLPSTSDLGALDPARRRKSVLEDRIVVAPNGAQAPSRTRLSHRDKLTIAVLAIANLFSMVVFSCIAPFFPEEAKSKGASETAIGFVFGIFELVIVLVSRLAKKCLLGPDLDCISGCPPVWTICKYFSYRGPRSLLTAQAFQLTQLGSKFTFGTGLCVTGVTSILFG